MGCQWRLKSGGESRPPPNTRFIGPKCVPHNRLSKPFCTDHPCAKHRQTDHATCNIYSKRPHLCTACGKCGLIITNSTLMPSFAKCRITSSDRQQLMSSPWLPLTASVPPPAVISIIKQHLLYGDHYCNSHACTHAHTHTHAHMHARGWTDRRTDGWTDIHNYSNGHCQLYQ